MTNRTLDSIALALIIGLLGLAAPALAQQEMSHTSTINQDSISKLLGIIREDNDDAFRRQLSNGFNINSRISCGLSLIQDEQWYTEENGGSIRPIGIILCNKAFKCLELFLSVGGVVDYKVMDMALLSLQTNKYLGASRDVSPSDKLLADIAYRYLESRIPNFNSAIDKPGIDGDTPLAWATRKGIYSLIDRLVSEGANVNASNADGQTPIMVCTTLLSGEERPKFGSPAEYDKLVRFLLKHGANLDLRNSKGETATDIADKQMNNAFFKAVKDYRIAEEERLEQKQQEEAEASKQREAEAAEAIRQREAEEARQKHALEQGRMWGQFLAELVNKDAHDKPLLISMLDYECFPGITSSDLSSDVEALKGKFLHVSLSFESDAPGGVLAHVSEVLNSYTGEYENGKRIYIAGIRPSRFVSDQRFSIIGRVKGTYKYLTVMGGSNTVLSVSGDYVVPE